MSELRWTPQQAAAITETRHALLVANAGTGKTATVVGKIRWLLGLELEPARAPDGTGTAELPDCPDTCDLREIAAVTFTEKAAYDLKRKLREAIMASSRADELRWQIDRASIGTIHSFCGELLREHALRLEIDPTFRVLDAREAWAAQDEVIAGVVKAELAAEDPGASLLLQRYSLTSGNFQNGVVDHVRNAMYDLRWHPERYERWTGADGLLDERGLRALCDEWDDDLDGASFRLVQALVRIARLALAGWRAYLAEENARDFDALILDARRLLTGPDAEAALAGIRRRYRILVIDEFQDTDGAQRDVAFAIAGLLEGSPQPRPQLFLVGDPKQSIYRFRGADIAVWNEVEDKLGEHGAVLDLSENFRCAPPLVSFVNDACGAAIEQVAAEVEELGLGSGVAYTPLVPGVPETSTAALEWLASENRKESKTGKITVKADVGVEAEHTAARIREMVGRELVIDPDSGQPRPVAYRDVAVLYRTRSVLRDFEAALARCGVPYYVAGAPHLGDRQEILDLLNLLRLLRNPRDDYRAFGFLRSPFVALRDEVLVRIAMAGRGAGLLRKARNFLRDGQWFDGPEGEWLSHIEREALGRALAAFQEARELIHRAPVDEVVSGLLDRTGYRLHLILGGDPEEPLANIQSFLQFAEEYRDLDISTFLEVWDRWEAQDNGLPQAPLYSKDDDVVTLTTIHRAKGLEWPVVFVVGTGSRRGDRSSNDYWSDPRLGPLLCPPQAERGARARSLWRRNRAESDAEDARLLYVAATRARDRLVIVGPRNLEETYSAWLAVGVDGNGFLVRDEPPAPDAPAPRSDPELGWLSEVTTGSPSPLLAPVAEPPARFVVSATELMGRAKDERSWRLRYRHGVQPKWEFAGPFEEGTLEAAEPSTAPVPATVRGTVIHGVLERIRDEAELSRLLREAIGGLDDPDLEAALVESRYREQLEEEIRRVIRSEQWAWYVEGEHWRELEFVHLAGAREWRVGAFDLYRPGPPGWVIDFKTHEIEAEEAERVAGDYEIQVRVYREASAIRDSARVGLHFTGPNVLVEPD